MTCMECLVASPAQQTRRRGRDGLLLFLLLFFLFFSSSFFGFFFTTLWSLGITSLLAWPLSEPLGEPPCRSLGEFGQLVLPGRFKSFGTKDLSSTFVELLPVSVAPGVCPPLVLGEHSDGGRVLAGEGLRVKTLLDGLVSHLKLLSFSQFFEFVLLILVSLFEVVFVSLEGHNGVPDLVGLGPQFIRVHRLEG